MSDDKPAPPGPAIGPWGHRNPDQAPRQKPAPGSPATKRAWLNRALWAGAVLLCGAALLALTRLFPGALSDSEDWRSIALQIGFLVLVASGLLARRLPWRQTARYVLIWGAAVSVLVLGVAYRSELTDAGLRLRAALVPSYAVDSGAKELVIGQSQGGQYQLTAQVNGAPVQFLVDTGATDIVLSPEDARRIGLNPSALRYDRVYGTANGAGRGAAVRGLSLAVGPIRLQDVEVSVNQAPMSNSLLGMSFVRRLKSMRFEGDRLILTPRT